MRKIIDFLLNNRWLVLAALATLVACGLTVMVQLPIAFVMHAELPPWIVRAVSSVSAFVDESPVDGSLSVYKPNVAP